MTNKRRWWQDELNWVWVAAIVLAIFWTPAMLAHKRECIKSGGDWVTHYWAKGAYHKCEHK